MTMHKLKEKKNQTKKELNEILHKTKLRMKLNNRHIDCLRLLVNLMYLTVHG